MESTHVPAMTFGPEDGPSVSIAGGSYRIVIDGHQTGGAYAIIEMQVPPGGGPGPHAHAGIQESFYVMEGEVQFTTETQQYTAKKGSFINIPLGGMVHQFKNKTDQNAKLWCTVVPAGLEQFFLELGAPITAGTFIPPKPPTPEDMVRIKAASEKYGQILYPPDYLAKQ